MQIIYINIYSHSYSINIQYFNFINNIVCEFYFKQIKVQCKQS